MNCPLNVVGFKSDCLSGLKVLIADQVFVGSNPTSLSFLKAGIGFYCCKLKTLVRVSNRFSHLFKNKEMVILTDHAVMRLKQREVPDPRHVKIKKATDKVIKQNDFGYRLKGRVGYTYQEGSNCYLYICLENGDDIVVLTAYKYGVKRNTKGRRHK